MKEYTQKKRIIQSYFYNKSPTRSNVVALAGNNLDLHLEDIKKIMTNRSKAFIYDLDISVINKFKHLSSKKIELINDDILNCNIERFIDLDLMCTLDNSRHIISYIFDKQIIKYKNNRYIKTFMFTYCHRNNSRVMISKVLRKILSNDIEFKSIETKSYRDGAPMCTVQIIWK